MRLGEPEPLRIAELGKPVDDRAAGISEPHHLGAFVECLADGVVDGLPENFVFYRAVDLDYLGVAS